MGEMNKIKKKNIKIKNKSIPIDLFLLEALSLKHFNTPYGNSQKEVNNLVRELSNTEEENFHPQNIERYIVCSFLPKEVRQRLKKINTYKTLC
jgi:hypothetical protein